METGVIILTGILVTAVFVFIIGVFIYAIKTSNILPKTIDKIIAKEEENRENTRKMKVYSDLVKVIKEKEEKRCS